MSTKRKIETAEEIVSRGYELGYSGIAVKRGGNGVEWGMPFNRNMAWERLVKRRIDDIIAYLRKNERSKKAKEKAAAAKPDPKRESMASLTAKVASLRVVVAELEALKRRVEVLERAMPGGPPCAS